MNGVGTGRCFEKKNPGPNFVGKNIQDMVNSIVRIALYANKQQDCTASESNSDTKTSSNPSKIKMLPPPPHCHETCLCIFRDINTFNFKDVC